MWHVSQEDIEGILGNHGVRLRTALQYIGNSESSQPDYNLMLSGKVTEDDVASLSQFMRVLKKLWLQFGDLYHAVGDGKQITIELGSEAEQRSGPGRRSTITYVIYMDREHFGFGYVCKNQMHQLLNFSSGSEADLNRALEEMYRQKRMSKAVYKFFMYVHNFYEATSFHDVIKTIEWQLIPANIPQDFLSHEHIA